MNPQQQLQLEDAQKKLSIFRKHLDLLARCTGESKNVEKDEVLSAVTELQSLVEWAAQQPELGAESAVLLVKLQELHQIREDLEKPTEEEEYSLAEVNDGEKILVPEESKKYSKDLEYISDVVVANLCDNNGENNIEEDSLSADKDSLSVDKDSLCDYSASTEDPYVANAESPQSIEDTNVDIIPSDDKTEETIKTDEKDNLQKLNEKESTVNKKVIFQENPEIQQIPSNTEEEVLESQPNVPQLNSPDLFRSEIVIIETDEDNKSTEWVNENNDSNDPLNVCMFAIRNLYESLRVKENELLKLSAMQNDQKHIEALQAVIIDFHKDITNLTSELEISRKENTLLKEQVLELEEAENDARSEAQKLEQKLTFLQEKDSHSQAELSQLKQSLKKNAELLASKDAQEREFRSQIKYMETLVQQYEDQIKTIEAKEITSSQKTAQSKSSYDVKDDIGKQEKRETSTKGTQTYPQSQVKINCNGEPSNNNNNDNEDANSNFDGDRVSEETACEKQTKATYSSRSDPSTNESTQSTEQADLVKIENISQKELLKRLHKLIDEDVSLQQQIHYVDEINLAMWKKLQSLDNHIGECKRQNINETTPTIAVTEVKESNCTNSEAEIKEPNTNENIPQENASCLEQNEQYIQERLAKLEEINAAFEKELKTREDLCKEKEKKCEEWVETEKRVMDDLSRLSEERDWITTQVSNLEKEVEAREKDVIKNEQELASLRKKNQEEISKLKEGQEAITEPLNVKVNQMLTKEKEILKMITNLKSQKNRTQGKSELERLKCNYIELQLELSQTREEVRKIEDQFKVRLDERVSQLLSEETQRKAEIDRLRNENVRCDKMITKLQRNKKDLLNAMAKEEKYLQEAREIYKKNLEETEEEHRSVETELESQLRQMEEGTIIATTVLQEERMKVEKELQENIEDLKAKEEVYKAKIAELERDVINLHKELHKMAADSEEKKEVEQLQEDTSDQVAENTVEVPLSKPEELNIPVELSPDTEAVNADENAEKVIEVPFSKSENLEIAAETPPQTQKEKGLSSSSEDKSKINPPLTVKPEILNNTKVKKKKVPGKVVEENVDELRAQVRELQSHIEKISEDVPEFPPVQPVTPITAKSLKMQKVEDIDYAEVDECCSVALRKPVQNTSTSKDNALNNSPAFYGGKYPSRHKDNLKNQRTPSEESVEENDYDEVLPRPTNFHVVQQVGPDTLLVGWNYVNPSVLDGFEVYLGNQVHERIYIPDRTKALISGLNLRKANRLSICALSRYGQTSEPTVLEISAPEEINAYYYEDEEDEYRDIEDPMKRKQRPYSMEW